MSIGDFPGRFESSNVSRDNVSRGIGRISISTSKYKNNTIPTLLPPCLRTLSEELNKRNNKHEPRFIIIIFISYYIILYYIVPYGQSPRVVLYYTTPHHTIPYHTILYYTILCYNVLYNTILYYAIIYR